MLPIRDRLNFVIAQTNHVSSCFIAIIAGWIHLDPFGLFHSHVGSKCHWAELWTNLPSQPGLSPKMSSSMDTIEIVGGVHAGTKRLQLKSVLERYGEIDICHKDRLSLDHEIMLD